MIGLFLHFLFLIGPGVRAEEANAYDCAGYFETLPGPTFEIDPLTNVDLEIDRALAPEFERHLLTSIGKARLRHLLRHPHLDRATLTERQEAIKALADNVHRRRQVRENLAAIEKAMGQAFNYLMNTLVEEPSGRRSSALAAVFPAMQIGGWSLSGAAYLGGGVAGQVFLFAGLFQIFTQLPNMQFQESARSRLYPFQEVFANVVRLAEVLSGEEGTLLADVKRTFAALTDADLTPSLREMNRRVSKLSAQTLTTLGSVLYLTNLNTRRARRALVHNRDQVRRILAMVGELDVLAGLAEHYDLHRGDLVFPQILSEDHPTHLVIERGHHPLVWSRGAGASVANDVRLSQNGRDPRFWLLTGPHSKGKSAFLKMIGTNVLLAQIGAPVPAARMKLTPMALFTNKNTTDGVGSGESSFEAQCRRVAHILNRAESHPHCLVLADEILTGTSPEEHHAIERAVMEDLVGSRYVGMLASHDRKLQALEGALPGVRNMHVSADAEASFTVRPGRSDARNALDVLARAGVKASIVEAARRHLEENHPELKF